MFKNEFAARRVVPRRSVYAECSRSAIALSAVEGQNACLSLDGRRPAKNCPPATHNA